MRTGIEKRLIALESKHLIPEKKFIPARWLTLAEAEIEEDIKYGLEEANNIDIEHEEERARAAGDPEWIIACEREQRADYYRRKKAKQEAKAQQAREEKR